MSVRREPRRSARLRLVIAVGVLVLAQAVASWSMDDAFLRVAATLCVASAAVGAGIMLLRHPEERRRKPAIDGETTRVVASEDPRVASLRWQIERLEREYLEHIEGATRHREELTQDLRQRATDLARARSELARVDKARDEFVAVVAHEFRTPLAAIRSFAEILLNYKGELNDSDRVQFLEIVRSQSERLARLVEELLDISRIRAGRAELRTGRFPVAAILTEVFESMSMLARSSGHVLELAGIDAEFVTWCDRDRTVQIVTNLVSNALKYTAPGTRIEIDAHAKDPDTIAIVVRDHGVGLSQHEAEHLFEAYFRDERKSAAARGTGLGLHISREFARKMGGELHAARTDGGGASFTLLLPTQDPRLSEESTTADAASRNL